MRPELDELDRFKNRKTGPAAKPGAKNATKPAPAASKSKSPLFLVALVFILCCVSGALAWGYIQQEQRVANLDKDLKDAIGFISQSKLLIARLEGELSQTGEVLEQSGSAASKKLAFLDSEMRKLWGVSNDRNRKAIDANKAQLESVRGSLDSRISAMDGKLGSIVKSQSSLERAFQQLNETVRSLETKVSLSSGEMAITREAINEDMERLRKDMSDLKSLKTQIVDNQKAIASIDSSRRQVNERLVDLGRQVNELRLNAKATP